MAERREVKLKPKQLEDLHQQLKANYDEARQALGDWPERHERRYRRYLTDVTLRPEGPYPESPKLFTSHTRRNLEKILGELWTAVFGSDDAIKLEAWKEEDVAKAERATKFERWVLSQAINDKDKGGWDYISYMALFDALIDGAGILKVYRWRQPWSKPAGDDGRWLDSIIRIDNVDQSNLLIPPGVSGLQFPECEYLHERLYMRMDDLKRRAKDGWNVPDSDKVMKKEKPLSGRQKAEQERDGGRRSRRSNLIEVVESYERFAIDDLEEDLVIHWYPDYEESGDGWMARLAYLTDIFPSRDRPRNPYFSVSCWLQPRQFRGLNVPDRMESPQDILNRLHEQLISYGEISMLPFFFVNTMVTGDIPDLRQIKPGQGVPVNSMEGVQFATRQSLNRHFIEQIQTQGSEIEADMGVSDFALGRSPDRPNAPRTASATMAILQEGKQNWGVLVHHVKNQLQAPLNFHFQLQQDNMQPGMQAKIGKVKRTFALPAAQQEMSGGMFGPETSEPSDRITGDDVMGTAKMNLAERVLGPAKADDGQVIAEVITKDEISGTFDVSLDVDPNGMYDRQVLTTFAEQLGPVLQQVYPLGFRNLIARIWELYNLQGFDKILPEHVATLWTQVIAAQTQISMLELKVKEAELQGILNPQGPDPEQQQMMAAIQQMQAQLVQAGLVQQAEQIQIDSAVAQQEAQAKIHAAQSQIQQNEEKTGQAKIKTAAEGQKFAAGMQQAEMERERFERELERGDAAAEGDERRKDEAAQHKQKMASHAKGKK